MTWLPPAVYIDTQADLERYVKSWKTESLLAIDTESNSLYVYQERVCLIQVSTRRQDFIIDPLVIDDLSALNDVFSDPKIEKIFHAAEYDLLSVKRDFGFTFCNLFDTLIAARICGFSQVGLSHILLEYTGIHHDKSHQLDNWGLRPLPEDSLAYAQMDTHYLPFLRDEFEKLLRKNGSWDEAQESFADVCHTPPASKREFDPNEFWHIGLPGMLNHKQLKVLRELCLLREALAVRRNLPPNTVLSNKALVEVSRRVPGTVKKLRRLRYISTRQSRRDGTKIIKAVKQGLEADGLPDPPRSHQPDPSIADRYTALAAWRKERAQARGVESDVIISKQTLWTLAHKAPTQFDELHGIQGLGPWRLDAYGHEILQILQEYE